jgi:hypothetical protein
MSIARHRRMVVVAAVPRGEGLRCVGADKGMVEVVVEAA